MSVFDIFHITKQHLKLIISMRLWATANWSYHQAWFAHLDVSSEVSGFKSLWFQVHIVANHRPIIFYFYAELMSTASTRMKRAHFKGPKNRNILQLYNKLNILLNQMVELVEIQPLTDTSILQVWMCVGFENLDPVFGNPLDLVLSYIPVTRFIYKIPVFPG